MIRWEDHPVMYAVAAPIVAILIGIIYNLINNL